MLHFEQILINLENYGDSDIVYDDGGDVLSRFIKKKDRDFADSCISTKPCLKMEGYNVEYFIYKGFPNCISLYNTTCDVNGDKVFPTRILFTKNEDCVIRHYKTKTIEEYIDRHKHDCHYDMNIQLVAKKLKGFFEVNNSDVNLQEKLKVIKREYSWYVHYDEKTTPVDVVLVDDNNPILEYTIKSIRKNLPWVNKIYVITNNSEINEKDIIIIKPESIIPDMFKERDVEVALFLHNIKDLSERFIYVYSGTIFNYKCFEEEFFRGNKICMSLTNFRLIPNKYRKLCYNNSKFFLNRKDIASFEAIRASANNFGYMFSRTCCPMLKSENDACYRFMFEDIKINVKNINHWIYPTWTRIMYNNFDYMHTNVSIEECENYLLEIIDPIYKIINIPNNNNEVLKVFNERYNTK